MIEGEVHQEDDVEGEHHAHHSDQDGLGGEGGEEGNIIIQY